MAKQKSGVKGKLLKKVVFGSSIGMVTAALVIIIPCLMILDFFGANITDNYVENNMDYAEMYKETVNKTTTDNYRLRMWVDSNYGQHTDGNNTTEFAAQHKYILKVNVYGAAQAQ